MEITFSLQRPTEVVWRSGSLLVGNPPPEVLQTLTYTHKSLVGAGWGDRKTVREKVSAWAPVPEMPDTIITYQGFYHRVIAKLKALRQPFRVVDERLTMPPVQMRRMTGFRGTQALLFLQLIRHNQSGLLQAPTRFGKSIVVKNLCRVWPDVQTVVAAPGVDLLNQLVAELRLAMPDREVKGLFTGSKDRQASEDITVCSLDSLGKVDHTATKLLIVDEAHAMVSPSRLYAVGRFENARIYGIGATLEGRYDGADLLIEGVFGPVLARKTFKEAVQEGAICPIRVYLLPMQFALQGEWTRDKAYRALIYQNQKFVEMVQTLCWNHIPTDWQTLVFVDEKKQASLVAGLVENSAVAVASGLSTKERRDLFNRMVRNEIKRCVATDIFSTGVTFPDLRVVINAAGGGGSITGTQKPGRLAQNRPGKKRGYLVDFIWQPADPRYEYSPGVWRVALDAKARREVYERNGYEVVEVKDVKHLIFE